MKAATIVPRMSPTPPRMTMISAFRVNTTPSETSNVKNMLSRPPPAAVTAPPSANASAEVRETLIGTSPAADRIDGHRPQRQPCPRLVQPNIQADAERYRGDEGDHAVQSVAFTENENRLRQIRIIEVLAAEDRQHDPNGNETEAEGRQDAVDLKLALALGAANERQDEHPVDHPVQDEGNRHHQEQCEERARVASRIKPKGGKRPAIRISPLARFMMRATPYCNCRPIAIKA